MAEFRSARAASLLVAGTLIFIPASWQIAARANDVQSADVAGGEVVFGTFYVDHGEACTAGFTMTYPADALPQGRSIRTTQDSNVYAGGDDIVQIPAKGPPGLFRSNTDGTVTFRGGWETTASPCATPNTGKTLAIGPCVSGDCLPARFVAGPEAERLGLRETEY